MNVMMRTRKQSQGFTLIEVLLAMGITAFVAVLAYSALSASITSSDIHERKAQQLADVQLALTFLERDIRHAAQRSIIDEYGDNVPAMTGGEQDDYLLRLTRRGWDNPTELRRGELQRVRYQIEDEALWRESWLVLDRTSEDEGLQRAMLLDNVIEMRLRFLEGSASSATTPASAGEWRDDWVGAGDRLPLAVELELDIENFGQVKRVFSVIAL